MSAFGGKADIAVGALAMPVLRFTIRRRDPISMAYRGLQKQHRSFVPRQTLFK
jgi:hypothetical protein